MKKCALIKVADKMSLKEFCKRLQEYTECYIGVPFQCSTTASDVSLEFYTNISVVSFWVGIGPFFGSVNQRRPRVVLG